VRRPLLHPRRNTAIGVFRAPQEDRTQSPAFPELAQLEFSVIPDGRKSALNHNRTLTRVTAGHRKAPGAVRMDIDIMSSARPAHLTRVSTAQRPDPRDVSHSADQTSDLFEQAPPGRIQLRLKLVAPGERRVRLRAGMVVLIGWLPLALLSLAYEPMFWRGSFFADMGAQALSLIAAPLLVLAEGACAPRLGVIVRHFVDSGLVGEREHGRFQAIVDSTARLLRSAWAELTAFVFAYAAVVALFYSASFDHLPAWYLTADRTALSPAACVSVPLLMILLLGWLWRLALWAHFLCLISRLDLRLVPAHPDRAAGLAFLGQSVRAFTIIGLAIASVVAGRLANVVLHYGTVGMAELAGAAVCLAVAVALFVAPLTAFSGRGAGGPEHIERAGLLRRDRPQPDRRQRLPEAVRPG
jgi:hypothetical protein